MEVFRSLPYDMIHEILDYFNYAKYCKPEHQKRFSGSLRNINDFRSIFPRKIVPMIVKSCLGKGNNYIESWGIATTRNFVEEVLEPYYETRINAIRMENELRLLNEMRRQRENESWKQKRKRLIKNKIERMLQQRLE